MSNSLSSIFKVTNFSKLLRIAGVLVLCGHTTAVSAADSLRPDIFKAPSRSGHKTIS